MTLDKECSDNECSVNQEWSPDVGVFGCKSGNLQDEHAGVFESNKLSQDWQQSQWIDVRF